MIFIRLLFVVKNKEIQEKIEFLEHTCDDNYFLDAMIDLQPGHILHIA